MNLLFHKIPQYKIKKNIKKIRNLMASQEVSNVERLNEGVLSQTNFILKCILKTFKLEEIVFVL